MKGLVLVLPAFILGLVAAAPIGASAEPLDAFVEMDVQFEIPQKDLIPGIAAVRASCGLNASGEPVAVLANGTERSTLAIAAGPCSVTLVLGGVDVVLPVLNTTPLGRSSFYLPGVATVTLGIVDLTIDLVTSLNSTSRVESAIADVTPQEIAWSASGAKRILIHGQEAFGSVAHSSLNTTFTYTMSLALSVYAFSIKWYEIGLAEIGSAMGTPSLRTGLSVDLRPHGLALSPAEAIRHDGATISWTGGVDEDVDHLELWLTDGTGNVSVLLLPTADRTDVLTRPSTEYRAWIVAVDGSGQATPSNGIVFESAAAPADNPSTTVGISGDTALTWTLVGLAVLAGAVGYAVGVFRRRKTE